MRLENITILNEVFLEVYNLFVQVWEEGTDQPKEQQIKDAFTGMSVIIQTCCFHLCICLLDGALNINASGKECFVIFVHDIGAGSILIDYIGNIKVETKCRTSQRIFVELDQILEEGRPFTSSG